LSRDEKLSVPELKKQKTGDLSSGLGIGFLRIPGKVGRRTPANNIRRPPGLSSMSG
jgi:hypothetical protein